MSAKDNSRIPLVMQQGLLDLLGRNRTSFAQASTTFGFTPSPSPFQTSADESLCGDSAFALAAGGMPTDPTQAHLGDWNNHGVAAPPQAPASTTAPAMSTIPGAITGAASSSSPENSPTTAQEQASPSSSCFSRTSASSSARFTGGGHETVQASWLGQEHAHDQQAQQQLLRRESSNTARSDSSSSPFFFYTMAGNATPTTPVPASATDSTSVASLEERGGKAWMNAGRDGILHCPAKGCRKTYRRPSHLRRHLHVHKKKASLICPFSHCGRGFHRKDHYDYHIRVHTGEKPFVCDEKDCGRAFRQRSALSRHKKTHARVRSLTCTYCRRIFANQQDLAVHMCASHTNELVQALPAGTLRLGLLALNLGVQQRLQEEENSQQQQQASQLLRHLQPLNQSQQQRQQQAGVSSMVNPEFLATQAPRVQPTVQAQHAAQPPVWHQRDLQQQQQPLRQHAFTPQPNDQTFISPLRFL